MTAQGDSIRKPLLTPGSWALLVVRVCALYAVLLAALVWWGLPVIYPAFARAARDVLVLSADVPRVTEIAFFARDSWEDSGFRIDTPLRATSRAVRDPALAFTVLFPVALLLAVPRRSIADRWRRLGVVAIGAILYGAFVLAYVADLELSRALRGEGLEILPAWRHALYQRMRPWGWGMSTIIFPVAASIYGLWPLLQRRAPVAAGEDTPRPLRARRVAAGFAIALVTLAALDGIASWRVAHLDVSALARALEPLNGERAARGKQVLGTHFARLGVDLFKAGDFERSRASLEVALGYPAHAQRARAGLREIERQLRQRK